MVLEFNKGKKIKIPYGSIHNKKSHENRGQSLYQRLHITRPTWISLLNIKTVF